MSALLDWNLWWPLPGALAVETVLLVVVAALFQHWVQSSVWRRTIWQTCLLGLVTLVALEFTGTSRGLAGLMKSLNFRNKTPVARAEEPGRSSLEHWSPQRSAIASAGSQPMAILPAPGAQPAASPRSLPKENGRASLSGRAPRLLAWLILIWLLGTAAALLRTWLRHFWFVLLRRGGSVLNDPTLNERIRVLSRQLGFRRPVRIITCPRFAGPIAFGLLRPTIGLPSRFATENQPSQQDVMLAHELVHLAAGDPVWYSLADIAAALLWWHPLAWWARRQLRAASEVAADEASLLVANGPSVLAECLVQLGTRLTQTQAAGWMGIEGSGFRSGLGRRVQRLVNLNERPWRPPARFPSVLARTVGPGVLVLAAVACTAWTLPESSNKGATMKHWKQALGVLTLVTALDAEPNNAAGDPPSKTTTKTESRTATATQPVESKAGRVKETGQSGFFRDDAITDKTQMLHRKLEQIILAEVAYDALPLDQVVQNLIRESSRLDPEKKGVNFLFGKVPLDELPSTIDPATGLPVGRQDIEQADLGSVTIKIMPPLKNVRLIDVLDAMTRVADRPIKYTIEEYAVVWTLDVRQLNGILLSAPAQPAPVRSGSSDTFAARAFKLDTNAFFLSVEKTFGIQMKNTSKDVVGKLAESVFPAMGVKLTGPQARILYNEVNGTLLVRAPAEHLSVIQATIELLGGKASASEPASVPSRQ